MPSDSIVVQHVGLIYEHANSGKGHSWTILNGALSRALRNAIESHLPFELDDFKTLYSRFKGSFWFGTDGNGKGCGEQFYAAAVNAGNMSACKSFEAWAEFSPWLWLGNRLCIAGHMASHHDDAGMLMLPDADEDLWNAIAKGENPTEEAVRKFGRRWFVTSLGADSLGLSYYYRDDNKGGWRTGNTVKRRKFTREEWDKFNATIRAAIRARKKELKAEPAEV